MLPELVAIDDRYLAMPDIGDTADLTFHVPPQMRDQSEPYFFTAADTTSCI